MRTRDKTRVQTVYLQKMLIERAEAAALHSTLLMFDRYICSPDEPPPSQTTLREVIHDQSPENGALQSPNEPVEISDVTVRASRFKHLIQKSRSGSVRKNFFTSWRTNLCHCHSFFFFKFSLHLNKPDFLVLNFPTRVFFWLWYIVREGWTVFILSPDCVKAF